MTRPDVTGLDEYRWLTGQLAAAARDRDTAEAAAEESYTHECHVLDGAVEHATARAVRARQRLADAAETMAVTDDRALRFWADLTALCRTRSGPPPAPATSLDRGPSAVECLCRVGAALDAARRDPPTISVPGGFLFLLPSLGAGSAALSVLLVRGLAALAHRVLSGGPLSGGVLAVNVLGQILVFLAPFAGVPVAVRLTRFRYGGRPDIGALGLVALGGMIACCAVVVAFR